MPELPTRVLLLRHGQSTWNAAGRWQGHADPPLSSTGRAQARAAAGRVGSPDLVVASDLQRARETAELIAEVLGVGPVRVDARFRERAAGDWTGLTRPEIERRWPGWLRDGRRPPGFELDVDIIDRVLEALHGLHGELPGGEVLVVSHGGVVRAVERQLQLADSVVPNLGGRWVEVHDAWMAPAERVSPEGGGPVAVTEPQAL